MGGWCVANAAALVTGEQARQCAGEVRTDIEKVGAPGSLSRAEVGRAVEHDDPDRRQDAGGEQHYHRSSDHLQPPCASLYADPAARRSVLARSAQIGTPSRGGVAKAAGCGDIAAMPIAMTLGGSDVVKMKLRQRLISKSRKALVPAT